ncbi:MAG: adenylate/guanylate cyclase domain-containing protein, partial [Spirochaetaceae bacterium]
MARKLLKTQYFSLVIATIVFGLFVALAAFTAIPERLELRVLNVHFNLRTLTTRRTIQEGVVFQERNPAISPSIEIIAVDTSSL